MADIIRIPTDRGGWIEVPVGDPRAMAYGIKLAQKLDCTSDGCNSLYFVQRGDTLYGIARAILGDANQWPMIAKVNGLHDPKSILVGQPLVIPLRESASGGSANGFGAGADVNLAKAELGAPSGQASGAILSLARGFMFMFFEQLPEVGADSKIIRKVAVVPRNYAFPFNQPVPIPGVGTIAPANRGGTVTPVEHVLDEALRKTQSPFLSASDRSFGAPPIKGTPLLIDVAKVKAAGGQIMTVEEVVAALTQYALNNPASREQVENLIWAIKEVEGEVLIRGGVPAGAAKRITGTAHLAHIASAEQLWRDHRAGLLSKAQLENALVELKNAYKLAKVAGPIGRVFWAFGVVLTAVDVGLATRRSFQQNSAKPLAAEAIRQLGGWGSAWAGAWAGAKIGAVVGALFTVETGPGAVVGGVVGGAGGAIVFGFAGFFGFDLLADQISPN